MLVANLPFAHGREAGIQRRSEHGLAHLQVGTQRANFFTIVLWNGIKAQGVELAHLAFVDKAPTMQVARCLVDSFKNSALSPGFCFHGKSRVTNRPVPRRRAACLFVATSVLVPVLEGYLAYFPFGAGWTERRQALAVAGELWTVPHLLATTSD